ncbi:LCP family protein [uncultured Dysosmobacter sp.]|uniref:LCP family protein n=1 Tax=uncultured Dysosmobacter sp. TaxID=2591384 RepID=UPI0026234B00|nr:LCP family protein [uncultured Dysosmobacter sp.]
MKFRVDRKLIRTAAVLLTALALFLVGALGLFLWKEGSFPTGETDAPSHTLEDDGALLFYNGAWYAPRDDVETVLVLGLDRSEQEEIGVSGSYAQSDLFLLLKIDRTNETYQVFQINRDTMAAIQDFDQYGRPSGTYTAQLALAYAHAQAYTQNDRTAGMAAMDAVSGLMYGVEIDHYVTLTMDGLMVLNDLAGGVTVEIRDDFSAADPALVQGETVTLLGKHALNYVRARMDVGEGTNLERMERQKEYLSGLQEKLSTLAAEDDGFISASLLELAEHMGSDCTAQKLSELAESLREYHMESYTVLEGEAVETEKYIEFYPDEEALQRLVIEEFYELMEEP